MPIKKEIEFYKKLKINLIWRWLRLLFLTGMLGTAFLALSLLVFVSYIASSPVNLTFIARHWLPLPVIAGIEKNKPAGKLIFDQLIMKWPIQQKGFKAPITFEIKGLKLLDVHDQIKDYINFVRVTLDTPALRHQKIVPLFIKLSGSDFYLKRYQNHHINLDLPEIGPPTQSKINFNLHKLFHIEIENTALSFVDEINHTFIQSRGIDIDIHPFQVGKSLVVIGNGIANFDINGQSVKIKAESTTPFKEKSLTDLQKIKKFQWHIKVDQVNPAHFSGLIPVLHDLESINVPISVDGFIDFIIQHKVFMQPCQTKLFIRIGQGSIHVRNNFFYPSSGYAQINAKFASDLEHPVQIDFPAVEFQLRSPLVLNNLKSGPFLFFKGFLNLSSMRHPKIIDLDLTAGSPLLNFSTLKDYWPSYVAIGAYDWITKNITVGMAHDFSIHAKLKRMHDGHKVKLVKLEGGIKLATGLEVHWLRPILPLQQMNAQMRFVDPDRILIKYQGGYQIVHSDYKKTTHFHKLYIPSGNMWITGLSNHHELGLINLIIKGELPDLLRLLSEPKLKLLSRHPLSFKKSSGNLLSYLHLEVPLKKKVKSNQLKIQGHNEIKNVYLQKVIWGEDLTKANLTVDVTEKHLDLKGKGFLSYFPSQFVYRQNFTHQDAQSVIEKIKIDLIITSKLLKQAGYGLAKNMIGQSLLGVDYTRYYNKKAEVNLNLDLSKSELKFPIWHKLIANPAMVSGTILLDHNKLVGIRKLQAKGRDLLIHADMNIKNKIPTQLNIQHFKTGRSEGKATINFPMTKEAFDDPIKGDVKISVKANILDLSPFIETYFGKFHEKHLKQDKKNIASLSTLSTSYQDNKIKGRRWIFNLQAQKIFYNKNESLREVTAYVEYNGLRLMRLSYGMRQPVLVTASLFPKNSNRQFYLDAQNFGNLLSIIGISNRIKGGHCIINGNFDDANPESSFTGKIQIDPFIVDHVPAALKRVSNFSVYGWFKNQKKDELNIDMLKSDLFLNKGILKIKRGRVYNAELGATIKGDINFDKTILDLQGTIVPVYAINKLFSHLPGLGKLFVPEKGGGLVAVPFKIDGKFKKPQMEVYPSMLLTPGFLRQLF